MASKRWSTYEAASNRSPSMAYSSTCSARTFSLPFFNPVKLTPHRTNHLSAVLSESATLVPLTGIPYKPRAATSSASPNSSNSNSISPPLTSTTTPTPHPSVEESPLFKPFAIECGFNSTLVDVLHDIRYLYATVDAFTRRLLPSFRKGFEEVVAEIEGGRDGVCEVEEGKIPKALRPRHGLV